MVDKKYIIFSFVALISIGFFFMFNGSVEEVIPTPNYKNINISETEVLKYTEEEYNPERDIPMILEFESLESRKEILDNLEKELGYEITITNEYNTLMNGVALSIKQKDLNKVNKLVGIKNVWEDENLTIQLEESVPLINADDVWKKQNSTGSNITGEGIIVAILDTGIAYNHSDFEATCDTANFIAGNCNKTVYGYDFYNDDNDPYDDHGHGTHVAGIVGANGELKGVAPNVTLLSYKVCSSAGSCPSSAIITAIENATLYGADIISISLGSASYSNNVYNTAINNAVASGVVVVISAGNNGYSDSLYTVTAPGNINSALTVGATDKLDEIAYFSSNGYGVYSNSTISGIKPDVVATGVNINSTVPIGVCTHCTDTGYKTLSGTSMAAPHVAGASALLKQKYRNKSPEQIKSFISNGAIDLGENIKAQGSGRIDILRSYNLTSIVTPNNVYFGTAYGNETDTWTFVKQINITNIANHPLDYDLGINISNEDIVVNLSNYSIILEENESIIINATIFINNSLVSNNDYSGIIEIVSNESQISRVPVAAWVLHNPDDCIEDDLYINEDVTLNYMSCDIPDFNKNGVIKLNTSNVTIDCNGSQFRGAYIGPNGLSGWVNANGINGAVGIRVSKDIERKTDGYDNVTIKNCDFRKYYNGIFTMGGENHTIYNNTLSDNKNGLFSMTGQNHRIFNNVVFNGSSLMGNPNIGLYVIHTAENFTIFENNISGFTRGVALSGGSLENNIFNNIFNNNFQHIKLLYSQYNIIENNTMNDAVFYSIEFSTGASNNQIISQDVGNANSYCFYAHGGNLNNTFKDSILDDCGIRDITLVTSSINMLNTTFNSSSVYFSDNSSNLTKQWYLTVNTTDENYTKLEGSNVSSYSNLTGEWNLDWNGLTNSNGIIANQPVAQYTENLDGRSFYYINISGTKVLYSENITTIYNLSENTLFNLILQSGENDTISPVTILSLPENDSISSSNNVSFECNSSDNGILRNVSLYGNWSGSFELNQTKNITGSTNSTNFIVSLPNGTYEWNCLTYDYYSNNSAFADSNFTFTIDTAYVIPPSLPTVTINSLQNNSYFNVSDIDLNFTTVSNTYDNFSCWYSVDSNITEIESEYFFNTIILKEPNTEVLEDVGVDFSSPDNTRGTSSFLYYGGGDEVHIKFNTSSIKQPAIIENSILTLHHTTDGSGSNNLSIFGLKNYTWIENTLTYNNKPQKGELIETIPVASELFILNVTNFVKSEYIDKKYNVSFVSNSTESSSFSFWSKEYNTNISKRPSLNISYFNGTFVLNSTENTINLSSLPEGEHNVNVICQDDYPQNGTSDTHIFYIDNTNPVMNGSSPLDNEVVNASDNQLFSISISDNIKLNITSGILYWRFPSDSFFNELFMACSSSSCFANLDTSGLGVGDNVDYYYEINDEAGNLGNNGSAISPLIITLDGCVESLVNTSWSAWADTESCQPNNFLTQSRSLVEYDENTCGETANTTHLTYQEVACIYDDGGGGGPGGPSPEYPDSPEGIVCHMSLDENTGVTAYDISGNSNDGTISGATWTTDEAIVTLTSAIDYTLNTVSGLLTIINSDYYWNELFVSWTYIASEDCPSGVNPRDIAGYWGAFVIGLLGFLGIIGIILGVIWLVMYVAKLFNKGGLNDLSQTA